jgi:hypothetical protein
VEYNAGRLRGVLAEAKEKGFGYADLNVTIPFG